MTTRRSFVALSLAALFPHRAFAANGRAALTRRPRPAPLPPGYIAVAGRYGVPPALLYAVALQESKLLFGQLALPYPWTLNIQGTPRRYDTYRESVNALEQCLQAGITNIDCGLLQINWKYHSQSLGSTTRALAPYPNIATGAQLLRQYFDATHSWYTATGRYHVGSYRKENVERAERYVRSVFQHLAHIPLSAKEVRNG